MKKIAIITPCILPVPASKGGAVEELITCIIEKNEISKRFAIDLYSIADISYTNTSYSYTRIIPISLSSVLSLRDKISDRFYRQFNKNGSSKRILDKLIVDKFMEQMDMLDEPYFAVIVQNEMSVAMRLIDALGGKRNFPIYFHMHNDVDVYRSPAYIRGLANVGVLFLAVSEYIKSQVLKYAPEAKVQVLYNGVDFEAYSMTAREPSDEVRFLYAGRIIPPKGVKELVIAFGDFLSSLPEDKRHQYSLDVIGFSDHPYNYEKQVMAISQKYSPLISCLKKIPTADMARKYEQYDVVVMPTLNEEPFGLVALETISKGIPLITTDSGALPEVVSDAAVIVKRGENFLVDLTSAIRKLALDSTMRQSLGRKGYEVARKRVEFDINGYYDRFVDCVDFSKSTEKVSIIVPVYNVKKYLGRCVESLINQTYTNIEIILVNDGSTDGSGKLCADYAATDSRIRVVNQDNLGLSGARDTGLDVATGEYVFFVDSDDFIDLHTIEIMLAQAHRCHAEVVACGFAHVFDGEVLEKRFTKDCFGIWSGKESIIQMMRDNSLCTVAWNKLYKASLWHDVRFPVGRIHEDEATTYKVLYKAGVVAYIPDTLYKYYQRGDSIMGDKIEKRSKDFIEAVCGRIEFFMERGETVLAEHARITYLEHLKYVYRNVTSKEKKRSIAAAYKKDIKDSGTPSVCGFKKQFALYLWQYCKY